MPVRGRHKSGKSNEHFCWHSSTHKEILCRHCFMFYHSFSWMGCPIPLIKSLVFHESTIKASALIVWGLMWTPPAQCSNCFTTNSKRKHLCVTHTITEIWTFAGSLPFNFRKYSELFRNIAAENSLKIVFSRTCKFLDRCVSLLRNRNQAFVVFKMFTCLCNDINWGNNIS